MNIGVKDAESSEIWRVGIRDTVMRIVCIVPAQTKQQIITVYTEGDG